MILVIIGRLLPSKPLRIIRAIKPIFAVFFLAVKIEFYEKEIFRFRDFFRDFSRHLFRTFSGQMTAAPNR